MIKNERQYRITKAQAEKFTQAIDRLEQLAEGERIHPLLRAAEAEALRSQLSELEAELSEYEAMRSAESPAVELRSFEELPRALIRARIGRGLSQKQLAEKLGLKEQQIQRYEATDYESASLRRVREIVRALDVGVSGEALRETTMSLGALFKRLGKVGLDRQLILKKLMPAAAADRIVRREASEDTAAGKVASLVGRVFGWAPSEILGDGSLTLDPATLAGTHFKVPRRANERRVAAYTIYAHYLALLVLQATSSATQHRVSRSAEEVRGEVLNRYGSISFDSVLNYVWSLGIPLLPLSDPGAFHGACWRVDARNVIVLKRRNQLPSLWLFDLLHELWHAGERPDKEQLGIVEYERTAAEPVSSDEEAKAGQFAGDVILGGRSEELAQLCVDAARGKVQRLKGAVVAVAERESVPVDGLSNYMAFRLSLQGINWWGAATNLQKNGLGNPWRFARDELLKRIDFGLLAEVDQELLIKALAEGVPADGE